MQKTQLIICGSIAIDRIMNFSGRYRDLIHPDKVHVLSISILIDKLQNTQGGTGANICYNLALLGEQPVLVGSAGPDARGYIKKLKADGINTEHVHISKLATATFNVITDSEDNQVGGFYPGAMADSAELSLKPWASQPALVTIAAHDPAAMRAQVKQCKANNLRLFYDPGQQVSNLPAADLAAGVAIAELLIVNDYELSALAKKIGQTLAQIKNQVSVVVTTLGREGSVIEGAKLKRPINISRVEPAKLVDPTGAGDAYRAGFLYGYLRQWNLQVCARLGAVVASFAIEHHGTQEHSFTTQEVQERFQTSFKQDIDL